MKNTRRRNSNEKGLRVNDAFILRVSEEHETDRVPVPARVGQMWSKSASCRQTGNQLRFQL